MSNSPYPSTYITKRHTFVENNGQRYANAPADAQLINLYATEAKSPDGVKYYLEQRGALQHYSQMGSGEGRGLYYWNGSLFCVIDYVLYRNGYALFTLPTYTGTIGFHEFSNGTNQKFLIVLDGTSGFVINTSYTVTKITSPNFPSPHSVHAAYIDGYLILAKRGTADLYNCNLEDPMTWTAGDFISAETFPDPVVALCRQNNYIAAIGEQTTEFFYDTGAFPGTPLARNAAALHQVGTPAPDTVVQIEEQIVFVSQTQTGGRTVILFNGFTPTDISFPALRRSLDAARLNITTARAFLVRSRGRKFYVLNLSKSAPSWVYDFDTQMWHQWADYSGELAFNCSFSCDSPYGQPYLLDDTNGSVYLMSEILGNDEVAYRVFHGITSIVVTDVIDFGVMNRKFMSRFTLIGDRYVTAVLPDNTVSSCTLSWSDNDYSNFYPSRLIDPNVTPMATITQLGMFRRRAFKLVIVGPAPRLEGFEVDINIGSQ